MDANRPLRILITGADGQVGHELTRRLADTGLAMPRDRQSFDLERPEQAASALLFARPECVVHCAAFTHVAEAERRRAECWQVNVVGTAVIAEAAARSDALFIHISTDYVFGRPLAHCPIRPEDPPGPLNYYGHSKLAAEHAVLATAHRHPDWHWWIVRTSALYERPFRWRNNFPQLLVSQRHRREGVTVVNDAYTVPTYVPHFVDGLLAMIRRRAELPSGIYHLVSAGQATWYEFAREIAYGIPDLTLLPVSQEHYNRMTQTQAGSRPQYSVLDGSQLANWLREERLPDWRQGVRAWLRCWHEQQMQQPQS